MKEKTYRILYCGHDAEWFDIIVPNYFANYIHCVNIEYIHL